MPTLPTALDHLRKPGKPVSPVSVDRDYPGRADVDELRRRSARWNGRAEVRRLLDGIPTLARHRARRCGFTLHEGASRAFAQGVDGKARPVGVETCEAARLCPVCGPAVADRRAAELAAGTWRWLEDERHAALFVTIAAGHDAETTLAEGHNVFLSARSEVMKSDSRQWKAFRKRWGIYDLNWTIEHTVGLNGPHPQLHMIFLLDRHLGEDEIDPFESDLYWRFRRALEAHGHRGRFWIDRGVDVRQVDDPAGIGRYVSKWGIGHEAAGTWSKTEGKAETSIAYTAIPYRLTELIGRRDPNSPKVLNGPHGHLVRAWREYAILATSDRRDWYRGFHKLTTLVPEVKGREGRGRMTAALDVIPAELRGAVEVDDAEGGPFDEEDGADPEVKAGIISRRAWSALHAAYYAKGAGLTMALNWRARRLAWFGDYYAPAPPLELAVCWAIEELGIDYAFRELAHITGATLIDDGYGLELRYDDETPLTD